jgi:Tfp pilus assembly protein PilN
MAVKIPINLASEPFRRDRPLLVASSMLGVILLITLIVQVGTIINARAQAADTRKMLDRVNGQLSKVKAEQAKLDATLSRPENAEVLDRSQFLNGLIERKAISWTRIFADLEKVVPYNVRLVSVKLPQVTSDNQVQLDMMVGAESPGPVFELLKRLETSPQFGPTSVMNSLPPSQTDKLWKYRVSVSYAQKL